MAPHDRSCPDFGGGDPHDRLDVNDSDGQRLGWTEPVLIRIATALYDLASVPDR